MCVLAGPAKGQQDWIGEVQICMSKLESSHDGIVGSDPLLTMPSNGKVKRKDHESKGAVVSEDA